MITNCSEEKIVDHMIYFDLTQYDQDNSLLDLEFVVDLLKDDCEIDEKILIYFTQELIALFEIDERRARRDNNFLEDCGAVFRRHLRRDAKDPDYVESTECVSYFDNRPDLCHPTDLPEGIHLNCYGNLITVPKGWISTDKDRRNPIINAAYKKHMAYAKVEWVKGQGKKSKYYPDHYIILNYWHHPSINPNPPKKRKKRKRLKK